MNLCASSYSARTLRAVVLGVAHVERHIALANTRNDLVLRSKGRTHFSVHHAFVHASNAGTECTDIAASLGMEGFTSQCYDHSYWPDRRFAVERLLCCKPSVLFSCG